MKNYKLLLILCALSLFPLVFTSVLPYSFSSKLPLDSTKETEHSWGSSIIYKVSLQRDQSYTIKVTTSSFWGMDVGIKISDTPYMISGQKVEFGSYTGEIMNFLASRTGEYYIQISFEGSGFYDITVNTGITDPSTDTLNEFFDVSYLLVLLLPTIMILLIGVIGIVNKSRLSSFISKNKTEYDPYLKNHYRKNPYQKSTNKNTFCQYCGKEINQSLNECPNCNTPFNE